MMYRCASNRCVLQGVVNEVSRRGRWEEKEQLMVLLQARSRGFLLRQRLSSRLLYLSSQGAAATTIQVLLSLCLCLSVSVCLCVFLIDTKKCVCACACACACVQSHWRCFVQRRAYRQRVQFLYQHWRAVVKVTTPIPPHP